MATLLESYEKMSEEIQAEPPLKRIWAVVPEEVDPFQILFAIPTSIYHIIRIKNLSNIIQSKAC